jgi:hypothetical protein
MDTHIDAYGLKNIFLLCSFLYKTRIKDTRKNERAAIFP